MNDDLPLVFSLKASQAFGEAVARQLESPLSAHEEREFEDGEHKSRPLVSVRGRDVYVIHSLYADAAQSGNDKLVRLLFFIGALKDAAAARVTAIVPYLAYARKDAKTQTRDPVTTRYVAQLFEAAGADRIVTLDVHNLIAFQNAFRIRTEHLESLPLFVPHFAAVLRDAARVAVVSPDIGGVKRAERLRASLARVLGTEVSLAVLEKSRARGVVRGGRLVGEVANAAVVVADDMIGTGATLLHAARSCSEAGATRVLAAATHGLFTGRAAETLADDAIERIVVTDSVPPFRLPAAFIERRLTVVSAAPLFAEAIRRLHGGGSLVELMETGG